MHRALGVLTSRSVAVGLLAVVLVALVTPRNSWFVFDPAVVGITWAVVLAAAVGLRSRLGALAPLVQAQPGQVVAAGSATTLVLAAAVTAGTLTRFGWDARVVARAAEVQAAGGALDAAQVDYFARFPNNVPLLAFQALLGQVAEAVGLPALAPMVAAQVLAVGVVCAALGWAAVVLGHPAAVVPVQAVTLVLLGTSPHLAAPYSDVPAAACVALAVLGMVYVRTARGRTRTWWAVVGATALGLGIAIKPFVGVLLIAVVLVVLAGALRRGARSTAPRALAVVAALAVLTGGVTWGVGAVAGQTTGLTDDRLADVRAPLPVTLWLASGTHDSGEDSPVRRYGAYRQDLIDLAASIEDPQEARQVLLERARDQVVDRGVSGNVAFFARKVAWVWGDGTFWAHGEGTDSQQTPFLAATALGGVAAWNAATGDHWTLRASLAQGIWLALLSWTALRLLRTVPDRLTATWALSLLGLTGYLVAFEARPRYVLALLPVVLALAVAGRGRRQAG